MSASLTERRMPNGDRYWSCSCGRSFDVRQWADDHLAKAHRGGGGSAAPSQFKADLERALWEARREGYERALLDAGRELQQRVEDGDLSFSTRRTQAWVAQRIADNRDERTEKPWLGA